MPQLVQPRKKLVAQNRNLEALVEKNELKMTDVCFAVILLGCKKPISNVPSSNYLSILKVSNQLEKPEFSVHVSHRAINHISTKIDRLSFIKY